MTLRPVLKGLKMKQKGQDKSIGKESTDIETLLVQAIAEMSEIIKKLTDRIERLEDGSKSEKE